MTKMSLFTFLKVNKAFDRYKHNVVHHYATQPAVAAQFNSVDELFDEIVKTVTQMIIPESWIFSSFPINDLPEPDSYWLDLDDKWKIRCMELRQQESQVTVTGTLAVGED